MVSIKIIGFAIFIVLLLGFVINDFFGYKEPKRITILEEDLFCNTNADCTSTSTHCNQCDCGSPVNVQSKNKYLDLFKKTCENYQGGGCDRFCPTVIQTCVNNKCELVSANVEIKKEDKACETNEDCTVVKNYCDFSICPESVNKSNYDRYEQTIQEICSGYLGATSGEFYENFCQNPEFFCINNTCETRYPDFQ